MQVRIELLYSESLFARVAFSLIVFLNGVKKSLSNKCACGLPRGVDIQTLSRRISVKSTLLDTV